MCTSRRRISGVPATKAVCGRAATLLAALIAAFLTAPALADGTALAPPRQADSARAAPSRVAASRAVTVAAARDAWGRVCVPLTVNGRGPYPFLLDSGCTSNMIPGAVADGLGLPVGYKTGPFGVLPVTDLIEVGRGVRLGLTHADARLGDLALDHEPFLVVRAKDPAQAGLIDSGILGGNLLKHRAVEIDYAAPAVTVYDGEPPTNPTAVVAVLHLANDLPYVDAEIDGTRGRFLLDTGCGGAMVVWSSFAAKHRLLAKYHRAGPDEGRIMLTGAFPTLPVRVGAVRIPDMMDEMAVEIHGPTVMISESRDDPTDYDGLIGVDLLSGYDVTLDYPRHRVLFTPRQPVTAAARR